jgi:hypothetical protein
MSLDKVYYNPKQPASFSSVAKLVKATKHKKKDVQEWLSAQDTYTLHKVARKRFPRNPYTLTNIDDVWEADLADLTSLGKYNNCYKYLLNVIDVFSRYAWSFPLSNKTGASVVIALQPLFKEKASYLTIRQRDGIPKCYCTAVSETKWREFSYNS